MNENPALKGRAKNVCAKFIESISTKNTNTIHNIHIIQANINFFLISKFLPIKVRYWRPLLNAKYSDITKPLDRVMSCWQHVVAYNHYANTLEHALISLKSMINKHVFMNLKSLNNNFNPH